ncbi:MAG: response regulator [Alphaproteobacteria bacterium]|nr:response regulator [Alphaproteobacteria bacterium]
MPSVLLVEDDSELRELLSTALEGQGLEVHGAGTVAEAWALLDAVTLDLVVIDGFLPDGSGVALIQELRDAGSTLTIIFLSALWRDEGILRRLTEELSVARVLHKPMGVQAFVAQVLSCLEQAAPQETPQPLSAQGGLALFRRELSSGLKRREAPDPDPALSAVPRVLVVDSEPGVHQQLKDAGRELFVELVLAAGPAEALALAQERRPDAALLEISLAARESGALRDRLRSLPGLSELPVGVLSEQGSIERRVQAADLGAQVFLDKPVGLQALDKAVRRLLAVRRRATRVLIVDDDPGFAAALREQLEAAGMEAHCVHQPRETLSSLAELHTDLLVIDGMMPDLSGPDLCRIVRASAGWEQLPILMLMAFGDEEAKREGYAAGADAVMFKGAEPQERLARIRSLIARFRSQSSDRELDHVTWMLHRRAFLKAFHRRCDEALRHGQSLSLGLLRLEGLDALRARQGALFADELLSAASRALSMELRGFDLKGRWGSAELCVGLPYAEAPQASRAMGRLARRLNDMLLERDELPVDVLFSVSSLPDDGLNVHALMRRAEDRLSGA